jgi:hypothetical protein
MFIVKSGHHGAPTPELLEAMNKLADREIKAGRLLDIGGLTPLVAGAQVRITNGKLGVVAGPLVEAKEVTALRDFQLPGKEEAGFCDRIMQLHKDLSPGWEGYANCEHLPKRRGVR